jgi:secondary thiamine-phosphate synthase enzyme
MRVETLHEGAVARNATGRLVIPTRGPGFTEITDLVAPWVAELRMRDGLLVAFCRHTSASLTIQENADPDVRRDLLAALDRLAPRDAPYVHDMEGPDDMPAHIRTMITDSGLAIPLVAGRLGLGTWQGIYLVEHRARPHRREVTLQFVGTRAP